MPTSACPSFPLTAPAPTSGSTSRPDSHAPARNSAAWQSIANLFQRISSPACLMVRQCAENSAVDLKFLSRYDADTYGRPRILSRLEIILHALAVPVLLGILVGFALAIFFHHSLPAERNNLTQSQAILLETNS